MIVDKALQSFKERYDREAVESIINLSHDITLYRSSFKGFNIQEAVNQFIEYMDGYVKYRIDNEGKPDAKPNSFIKEHTKSFIEKRLFIENDIPFNNATNFVQEYIDGVNRIIESVDHNQSVMLESTDDNESTACIVELTDIFMANLNNRFYPVMEHLLRCSGYYSRKALRDTTPKKKEQTFFL